MTTEVAASAKRPTTQETTAQTVAQNLRRLRTTRGLSLRALSAEVRKAGHALSPDAINKIENGRAGATGSVAARQVRRIDVDDLVVLARVLGVDVQQLLTSPTCAACGGAPPVGFTCNQCGERAS